MRRTTGDDDHWPEFQPANRCCDLPAHAEFQVFGRCRLRFAIWFVIRHDTNAVPKQDARCTGGLFDVGFGNAIHIRIAFGIKLGAIRVGTSVDLRPTFILHPMIEFEVLNGVCIKQLNGGKNSKLHVSGPK